MGLFGETPDLLTTALLVVYFGIMAVLSFYGSHRFLIVHLYKKYAAGRADPEPAVCFEDDDLPVVTVQLPLFNERYVAERLIDAVHRLDYPRDRLEVQVLDDSTDDTTARARKAVAQARDCGLDIRLIHRTERAGYKAGALQEGLQQARGELVAIFDADFLPTADFLRRTVHHFGDEGVGMVQARWGYINREYSGLTRAQAVLLDGHFILEHTARNRSGRFFNFNGTAGIWRRRAIEDAGGWEHETLTEDLDLSYRAQLRGWRFVFLRDLIAPSELPVEMNAFKSQQHRWAKGSIQTAIKLLPQILRAPLPWHVKHEAFYHLTSNIAYLLMVLLALLMPLATIARLQQGWWIALAVDLPIFLGATFSIILFYWRSQREAGKSAGETLRLLPLVLGLGIGLSVNNAKAVVEALVGHQSPFVRTAKYAIQRNGEGWTSKLYNHRSTLICALELGLGLWFTVAIAAVLTHSLRGMFSLPFLFLFQFGFFYVAAQSLSHTLRARLEQQAPMAAREERLSDAGL